MPQQLPVTVLAGSSGGDETWLVGRVQRDSQHHRVTAIVPNAREGRSRSATSSNVLPTTERLVRMGKGCVCCTVRGDLLSTIRRVAREATADHLVIQVPPHTDLPTVAKTFTVADETGAVLSSVARIESLVVVVSAVAISGNLGTSDGHRLVERVEFADVLVVTFDDPETLVRANRVLRALNPDARILSSAAEDVSVDALRAQHPYDLTAARRRASLVGVLDGGVAASNDVTRFAFRARRPFHPERWHALLAHGFGDVLRASGVFWVASRPGVVGLLNTVGGRSTTSQAGSWMATVPEHRRPSSEAFREQLEASWHPAYGDRLQELAFVGLDLDEARLREQLDRCLLTEAEVAEPERWSTFPHPFPWPGEEG